MWARTANNMEYMHVKNNLMSSRKDPTVMLSTFDAA